MRARTFFVAARRVLFAGLLLCAALPLFAQRAVVFPLDQKEGPPAAEWIGTGLAVALSDTLVDSGALVLPVADLERYFAQEDLVERPRFSPVAQVALAKQLGAGTAVRGQFWVVDQTVRAEIEAYSLEGDLARIGQWQASSSLSDLEGLANALETPLLQALRRTAKAPKAVKPEAFEAFIRGRSASDPVLKEVYFRKAVELEPQWDDARCLLALALADESRTTEAKSLLESLKEKDYPRAPQGLVALGLLYLQEGAVGDARRYFLASLRKGESPEAHIAMARLALQLKKPEEAARELRIAESFGTHQEEIDALRDSLRQRPEPTPPPAQVPPPTPNG